MGSTQSLHTILIRTIHYTVVLSTTELAHPPKANSVAKSCLLLFPNVLANSSLNKYTMWQEVKDQKKVFKKLKLVHTQVEKQKQEHHSPNGDLDLT